MLAAALAVPAAGYEVSVELKNLSGEDKRNWPVFLPVWHVFGRNLPPGSLREDGYRVSLAGGRELPFTIERLPPYDQPGNNELVVLIPEMKRGETLTIHIANTARASRKPAAVDLVGNPNNLIRNGGFEEGEATAEGWKGHGRRDTSVRHSGRACLRLTGSTRRQAACARAIRLHVGSDYYFGAWTRTENVSRHALYRSKGGYFKVPGLSNWFNGFPPENEHYAKRKIAMPYQGCATRDWWKVRFKNSGYDRWGFPRVCARAEAETTTLTAILDQQRQFQMEGKTTGTWWLDDVCFFEQPEWTVRHDLALKPHLADGLFVFTRPSNTPIGNLRGGWVSTFVTWPFPHEKAESLDRAAMKGQRVPFVLGLLHTGDLGRLEVGVKGGALQGPSGERLALTEVEYVKGMTPPECNHLLYPYEGAVRLTAPSAAPPEWRPPPRGSKAQASAAPGQAAGQGATPWPAIRYFVLSFEVGRSARAGAYRGAVELKFPDSPRRDRTIPVRVRVQDLVEPVIRDTFIGMIFQSESVPFNDAGLKQYSKSGFTSLTRFGSFFQYAKKAGGYEIDLEKTGKKIEWLKGYGITAGICPFSDLDLGLRWRGGALYKRTLRRTDFTNVPKPGAAAKTDGAAGARRELAGQTKPPKPQPKGWHAEGNKAAWQHEIKRLDAYVRKHPGWPQILYMTWDEPGYGPHGMPGPKMGWVNEVLPHAWTTLDAHFYVFDRILPYYTMPNFDDPADFCGPEIYGYLRKRGKSYGFAAAQEPGETQRYQTGMMMLASGARYMHVWHLAGGQRLMFTEAGKVLRSMGMVANGEGMDDFKACRLLRDLMRDAEADAKKRPALKAARAYLDKVFGLWRADHLYGTSHPYLGLAAEWGYDRFYNDWQETMLRHAAALKGVGWIE